MEEEELKRPGNKEPEKRGSEPEDPAPARGRARLAERMRSQLGERYVEDDDDANADAYLDDLDQRGEMNRRLAAALARDPRLAAAIGDLLENKRGAGASVARYFGRDLLEAEEGTPEYDEIMAAEEERRKEAADMLEAEERYNANVERTMPVVEEFCRSQNKDAEAFKQQLWDKIIVPVLNGEYTEELCRIVLNGLDYDRDIADAAEAGRIMGRNDNIETLREMREGGGMTSGFRAASVPATSERRARVERDPAFLAAEQA